MSEDPISNGSSGEGSTSPSPGEASDAEFAAEAVHALLRVSGLTPSAAEIDAFVAGFLPSRAALDALYDVPDARYEEPAVRFSAVVD